MIFLVAFKIPFVVQDDDDPESLPLQDEKSGGAVLQDGTPKTAGPQEAGGRAASVAREIEAVDDGDDHEQGMLHDVAERELAAREPYPLPSVQEAADEEASDGELPDISVSDGDSSDEEVIPDTPLPRRSSRNRAGAVPGTVAPARTRPRRRVNTSRKVVEALEATVSAAEAEPRGIRLRPKSLELSDEVRQRHESQATKDDPDPQRLMWRQGLVALTSYALSLATFVTTGV